MTTEHRLVILGSMDEFVDLVERARARGIYTIVCDGYENGPAKAHADKAYLADIRDTAAIADICRTEGADGIIASFSDLLAECMIDIADAAGLAAYLKPEQERYLREKPLMKEMFAKLGIPTPRSKVIRLDSLEDDFADLAFPCVVKPLNGYGSHGVFVAASLDEVRERFADAAAQSTFDALIAEEYNDGREFNAMTWIVDGQAHVLSIADREKAPFRSGDVPQVVRIAYPSTLTEAIAEDVQDIATKIAGYVGLENGPLCIQLFRTRDGKLAVCEAAGRIFGYEHELLELAGGLAVEDLLLDLTYRPEACKERVRAHSPYLAGHAAGLYFHGREGQVADSSAMDVLAQLDGVTEYLPYYGEGDVISHGRGAKPYAARYYIIGDSRAAIDALSDEIFDRASLVDAGGNELLFSAAARERHE